jgi:molecular chaperone GrpE
MNPDVNDVDVRPDEGGEPADDGTASGAAAAAEPDELTRAVEEREALRDRLLRATAEFDNYRKRVDRERRELSDRASEGILAELLPIVDDLERALSAEAGSEAAEAYRKGVELIHKQMLELLSRRGVTPMEALGADFDPHLHQAVASEPVEGRRDGEVIEVLRRGYLLGDRLLRAAMVKVAQA